MQREETVDAEPQYEVTQAFILGLAAAALPSGIFVAVRFGPPIVGLGAVAIVPALAFAVFVVPPIPAVLGLVVARRARRRGGRGARRITIARLLCLLGLTPWFLVAAGALWVALRSALGL